MEPGGWAARVAADWPAAEVRTHDGWRLGYSEGVTKRANSAVALAPDASLTALEAFYGERGAAPCVQVWPGSTEGIDGRLAERGYRLVDPTLVMVRGLQDGPTAPEGIEVRSRPSALWRSLWTAVDRRAGTAAAVHRIMDRVPVMGYAVEDSGAARGCVAVSGGWAGVYGMTTRAADRGRGHAGRIVEALLAWAYGAGARGAYLTVLGGNEPAVRAYTRAGFVAEPGYHYRVGAPPDGH